MCSQQSVIVMDHGFQIPEIIHVLLLPQVIMKYMVDLKLIYDFTTGIPSARQNQDHALTLAVVSISVFIFSSFLFFNIGCACGWFGHKHKTKTNTNYSHAPPQYENVQPTPTPDNQHKTFELIENVAYSQVQSIN